MLQKVRVWILLNAVIKHFECSRRIEKRYIITSPFTIQFFNVDLKSQW